MVRREMFRQVKSGLIQNKTRGRTSPVGMFEPSCSLARRRLENSNFVLLKIPVETHLFQRGEQEIFKDPSGLPNLLGLSEGDIECLQQAALVQRTADRSIPP